jgi:uncharacterized protein involved in exopolysaccharide biosynthesis/Mrp family chromosome partitioning ATPase
MDDERDELEEEVEESPGSGAPSLPFHIPTLLLGLWKRRNLVLYIMIPLCIFAAIFAKLTRTRVYRAHVMLLFDPPPVEGVDNESQLSVYTLMDLIKTPEVIDAARTKINLPVRVKTVASAIDFELRKKTTLLEINTEWDDAKIAADLANATYESFFEKLASMQGEKRSKELEDLQARLKEVKEELTIRDQELKEFTLENHIVDLDKEALAYLQQLVTLDTDYDREVSRLESVRKQMDSLKGIIEELRAKAAQEALEAASKSSSVTEANVKLQRLRERISESQTERARAADLSVRNEELRRATTLRKLDAISQSEYDQIVAEYEAAKAMSTDTEEITQWKEEIKKLDESIVPKGGSITTESMVLLQSLVSKTIDLQLEATASSEGVKALDEARKRAQARLNIIPQVKQAYTERLRRVEALAADRKALQETIALLTRKLGSSKIPFRVISRAEPALFHSSSNTKLIFIVIVMLGGMAVGGLVFLLELLDLTIKSRGSLAAALPAPPLAVLSHLENPKALLPGDPQPADHLEIYRRLILELKRNQPKKDSLVILITGAVPEAGVTTVALNIAARLQDKEISVLLLDAHTQTQDRKPRRHTLADFIGPASEAPLGLGDYLAQENLAEDPLLQPMGNAHTQAIICSEKTAIPELLNTTKFEKLIDQMRDRFSYILIDAPSLGAGVEAEHLAQYADAVIYVVKAKKQNLFKEKSAYKKVLETGTPILGTVLVDRPDLYASL